MMTIRQVLRTRVHFARERSQIYPKNNNNNNELVTNFLVQHQKSWKTSILHIRIFNMSMIHLCLLGFLVLGGGLQLHGPRTRISPGTTSKNLLNSMSPVSEVNEVLPPGHPLVCGPEPRKKGPETRTDLSSTSWPVNPYRTGLEKFRDSSLYVWVVDGKTLNPGKGVGTSKTVTTRTRYELHRREDLRL